jgi:hypothetical protein
MWVTLYEPFPSSMSLEARFVYLRVSGDEYLSSGVVLEITELPGDGSHVKAELLDPIWDLIPAGSPGALP